MQRKPPSRKWVLSIGVEGMWVTVTSRRGDRVRGRLSNDPVGFSASVPAHGSTASRSRSGGKSLSYGINMAAKLHAKAHGADDVVFVSPSGALLEGPTSSVVLDLDGVLVTPPLDGILRSITVAELIGKAPGADLDVDIRPLDRDDLVTSRGAWLLSSGRIIAPLTHADDVAIPRSPLDAALTAILTP
jgi:branched-subunit amino acid aminotransferase/4-amino-4-deoxychorismate lyase